MALGVILAIGILGGVIAFYSHYSNEIQQANDNGEARTP
jgi:hypothetical protein